MASAAKTSATGPRRRAGAATDVADRGQSTESRIAAGLRRRREELGLSINELAQQSGVSRAMIQKIEHGQVSPTAVLLGRLCNGLGMTLSSLIAGAENAAALPLQRADEHPMWRDPATKLKRTMLSPALVGARVEIVRIELPPGASVAYEPQRYLQYEQHVLVLDGELTVTLGERAEVLYADDCLFMPQLDLPLRFANRGRRACRYLVIIRK